MKTWVPRDFDDVRLVERPEPTRRAGGTPAYHWTHVHERLARIAHPGALAELGVAPTPAMAPIPPEVDDRAAATVQFSADAVAG